jgi:hypothetical protein
MNILTKTALKWGLIIGLANLVWLYLSYYAGLHTNGLLVFQLVPLVWLLITLAGYVLALREVKRQQPELRYWAGVRTGLLIAVICAVIAVLIQIGYHTVIHPAWPEYMTQQTRAYFSAQGLPQTQVEEQVAQARQTFALSSYATQSALSALVAGSLLSAIIMFFLQRKDRKLMAGQT